jgi:biopolymer transport protein ExbB/TolQ
VGLAGTVYGAIETLSKIAALAGAAGPCELAVGVSKALVPTFMALSVLSAAIFCSLILWRRRLLVARQVEARSRRPEDEPEP